MQIHNLNGGFRTVLQILITGMIGWLVYTVHHMEISLAVQGEKISSLQTQMNQLKVDVNENRNRN